MNHRCCPLILAAVFSCSGSTASAGLDTFRGKQVDLLVSKASWVGYLAGPEYRVVLTDFDEESACFHDRAGRFYENAGRLRAARQRGEDPPFAIIDKHHFCVELGHISALSQDGRRLWGTGSAARG